MKGRELGFLIAGVAVGYWGVPRLMGLYHSRVGARPTAPPASPAYVAR